MHFLKSFFLGISLTLMLPGSFLYAETFGLESLDLQTAEQGWGEPRANKSVDNHPIFIDGKRFDHGFGTHANSTLRIAVAGKAQQFTATVGVDDEVGQRGSVVFKVIGDGKTLWESGVMRGGDAAKTAAVDLQGIRTLILQVTDAGDDINYDHADWADAKIVMSEGKPVAIAPVREAAYILTPAASPKPRINGSKVFGIRPNSPFLFTIPATGERPMTFNADKLPEGLTLDQQNGHITGVLRQPGVYEVMLHARNVRGKARRALKIVCGGAIALTPPMGWNSWNCFGCDVNEGNVRAAADAMVASGLINHGWTYINIDDCWEQGRDSNGNILSNQKFPDMKALTDYVHSKGLKIGLYSSPGPRTCASHEGSYKHEEQDARRYAEWGFD